MLTSGFHNSKHDDRLYDATELASIFDGVITDGVYMGIGDHLFVSAVEGTMKVSIGSGRAWFDHSWTLNTSPYELQIEVSELLQDRIDAIVLDVDHREAYRENSFRVVKGTRSTEPERPTLIHEEYHKQYPLAYIKIPAGSTSINQVNIINAIGTSACPFVTGVVQSMNIDTLIANWEVEWDQKLASQQNEFQSWFANAKDMLDATSTGELINKMSWMNATVYANNWSASTVANLGDGNSYYTYNIPYNHLWIDLPEVEITTFDEDVVPTSDQVKAFSCITKPTGWVVLDTDTQKIWLYSKKKPTVDFRIKIQGVG